MVNDIFDLVANEPDVFDDAESTEDLAIQSIKEQLDTVLKKFDEQKRKKENLKITQEIKDFIREQVSKIKPVQNVIEKTFETTVVEPKIVHVQPRIIEAPPAPPPPPQIIKEVRVEVPVEKKDTRKYVEESKYLDLLVKVSKLENQLKETQRMAESPIVMPGGSGVIGIPAPEPKPAGYVLTVNSNGKAEWKASTGGGGGTSSDIYTPTNVTTDRSFDATNTSLDEISNVLGSLIASLQGAGIIQ